MTENPFWPPPGPDDIFGPILSGADTRLAVKGTLQLWEATYVTAVGKKKGVDLAPVQDWTVRPEFRTLPTTAAPAVMVTCPGLNKPPQRKGDGTYFTCWLVYIDVLVWGADWEPTEDLTAYYSSALTLALLQHPDLGDYAEATSWLGYRYSEVEHSSTRTLGVGRTTVEVEVDTTINALTGPAVPTDSDSLPPTVQTVTVNVTRSEP